MTAQARTSIYVEGNKYWLLDVEKDKHILEGAEFCVPRNIEPKMCTGNWKCYYTTLFLEEKQLYGVYYDFFKDEETEHEAVMYSNPVKLSYTGSCIIGKNADDVNRDSRIYYMDSYRELINHEYSYEISFENGVLKKVRDLRAGFSEYHEGVDWKQQEIYAKKYLQNEYGGFKDRSGFSVTVDEDVKNNMDIRHKRILGLEGENLIKLSHGIENSIWFTMSRERNQPFDEKIAKLTLGIKRNTSSFMKIIFSCDEDINVYYESTAEAGYSGPYDKEKAKSFFIELDQCGIFDATGGEKIRDNEELCWYINVEFKSKDKGHISGVNFIPSSWNNLLDVIRKLQIP